MIQCLIIHNQLIINNAPSQDQFFVVDRVNKVIVLSNTPHVGTVALQQLKDFFRNVSFLMQVIWYTSE